MSILITSGGGVVTLGGGVPLRSGVELSSIVVDGAGWVTFGLALPEGAATGVVVSGLATQNDIKTTWNDGSIRFVVVTAAFPSAGTFVITTGTPASGTFAPTLPTASTALALDGGATYTAAYPGSLGADLWLDGPLVQEGRVLVRPLDGATPHAFLDVVYDVRVYNDAASTVDVTVNNCRNEVASAATVVYTPTITVNGVEVFTQPAIVALSGTVDITARAFTSSAAHGLGNGDIIRVTSGPHAGKTGQVQTGSGTTGTLHYYFYPTQAGTGIDDSDTVTGATWERLDVCHGFGSRWIKGFSTGTFSTWTPDLTTFVSSGSLPHYVTTGVSSPTYSLSSRLYNILGTGGYMIPMADAGFHPDIGPMPLWEGFYLAGKTQNQFSCLLRNAELSGSFGGHGFLHNGTTPTLITDRPNYWLQGTYPDGPSRGWGGFTNVPEINHLPSFAVTAYLLTGRRYFYDEMRYWAHYVLFVTTPALRDTSAGLLFPPLAVTAHQMRGAAWGLRTLVHAAAFSADSDPDQAYFRTIVATNQAAADAEVAATPHPLEILWAQTQNIGYGHHEIAWWQYAYTCWALLRARQLGMTTAGLTAETHLTTQIVTLLTLSPPTYDPYAVNVVWQAISDFPPGTYTGYDTWTHQFESNFGSVTSPTWPTGGAPQPFAGYYLTALRAIAVNGIELGVTGAAAALAYLMSVDGEAAALADMQANPHWYVAADS